MSLDHEEEFIVNQFETNINEADIIETAKLQEQTIETPFYKKPLAKVGAAVAAATFVAGGAFALGNRSSDTETTPSNVAPVETAEPSSVNSVLETESVASDAEAGGKDSATAAPTKSNEAEQSNKTYGNIGIADMPLGENPISAIMPNGEEIQAPRLDDSNPQRFGETALALMACYMTTGSQDCLDEFSQTEGIQDILTTWRSENIEQLLANPLSKSFQFAIWDTPENPAVFEAGATDKGTPIIEVVSGDVRASRVANNINTDNSWQGDWTRMNNPEGEMTISPLRFMLNPDDPTQIEGIIWDITPNNS